MINTTLIIEDESFFSDILKDALFVADFSATSRVIHTSDEAEEYYKGVYKTNKPDCILVDINLMGSMYDGIEFVRRVNQKWGNNVVIGMISGSEDQQDIDRAKEVGAKFYLIKSEDVIPKIELLQVDYEKFKEGSLDFKVYK